MDAPEACPSCLYLGRVLRQPVGCERHHGRAGRPAAPSADPAIKLRLTPRPEPVARPPEGERPAAGTVPEPARAVFTRAEYARLFALRARVLGAAATLHPRPHRDAGHTQNGGAQGPRRQSS